ncbi:MAG: PTS system mannose/fructose/sorbose family transporter subunit IID [Deltaproteobacteria bacterium]|nr:PTS system mannose/fructose/sorbose family transporter subunit IID [Deltaproteobacteria bacterium]
MDLDLSKKDLSKMAIRQMLILSAFNPREMQAIGFAYAVLPALKRACRNKNKGEIEQKRKKCLDEAVKRHLEPFNTHPYLGAALVGAVSRLEMENRPQEAVRLKASASGPLGGIGDQVIWKVVLPAIALVTAAMESSGIWWSFLIFLTAFSLSQLGIRTWLTVKSFEFGKDVISRLAGLDLKKKRWILGLAAGIAGGIMAWNIDTGMEDESMGHVTTMTLATASFVAVRVGISPTLVFYLACTAIIAVPWLIGSG